MERYCEPSPGKGECQFALSRQPFPEVINTFDIAYAFGALVVQPIDRALKLGGKIFTGSGYHRQPAGFRGSGCS